MCIRDRLVDHRARRDSGFDLSHEVGVSDVLTPGGGIGADRTPRRLVEKPDGQQHRQHTLSKPGTALLLERLQQRRPRSGERVLPVLLAVGLLDQTPRGTVRPYAATRREYIADADFVRQIETAVPAGAMIYE